MRAFARVKVPPCWTEWEQTNRDCPDYARNYGSPTILVGGKDVAGIHASEGVSCCRIYEVGSGEAGGVPSIEIIESALLASAGREEGRTKPGKGGGWRSSLASLPGMGAAILPAVACPACWPAYAGILGVVGLGFLMNTSYLLPVTALLLLTAAAALAFRAKRRRGYGPFIMGLAASCLILAGKFLLASTATVYGGVALLLAASLWNAWPLNAAGNQGGACTHCNSGDQNFSSP